MGEEQFGLGSSLLTAVGDAVMCFYGLVIHGDSLDFLLLPVCFEFCRIEKANTAIARTRMTRTLHELCAESFFHLHTCLISLRGWHAHTHTHSSNDCFGLYLLSFVSAFQVFSRDDMQTAWDIFRKDLYGPDLTVWLCRHSRSVTTLHVMVGKKQSLSRDAFHLLQALIIQRSKFRDELYWVSQPLYSRCFVGTVYLQILSHQSEAGCFWPYG